MKISLDIHGVINVWPKFFSELSKLFISVGHEVHILTGSHITPALIEELKKYDMSWTELFSISDYNKEQGVHIKYDEKGDPWIDTIIWNQTKALYCERNKIDFHIDDTRAYGEYFTTPFALLKIK